MHAQEISIEVPSQGARRATEEGSTNGWKKPERILLANPLFSS
jgi:hypothetical protein